MTCIKVFKARQAMTMSQSQPLPVPVYWSTATIVCVLPMLLCAAVAENNKTNEKITWLMISFTGNCLEPSGLFY